MFFTAAASSGRRGTSTSHLLLHILLTLTISSTTTLAHPHPMFNVAVPQSHFEVLNMRRSIPLNPRAVIDAECIDRNAHIVFHDQNAAELAICDGISGSDATKCQGSPQTTQGRVGSALFTLQPTDAESGARITISKRRWEECVRAARAVCPTGSLRATCLGGASKGDVAFSLLAV